MKDLCCAKGRHAVDHCKVTRWFNEFYLGCKNLIDQTKSGSPKTLHSRPCPIEANMSRSTQRVSGKLGISHSSVVCHLHVLSKSSELHSESIKQAWHLTVQSGLSPSWPQQIQWVAFREYQASLASHSPVWFITFMTLIKHLELLNCAFDYQNRAKLLSYPCINMVKIKVHFLNEFRGILLGVMVKVMDRSHKISKLDL